MNTKIIYILLAYFYLQLSVQHVQSSLGGDSFLVPTLALPDGDQEFVIEDGAVESLETENPKAVEPQKHEDPNDVVFNSPVEPLMLYSAGTSVKGYWMRSKEAFDVVTMRAKPAMIEQPSITQALSIFFDMLNIQPSPTRKSEDLSVKATNTIVGVDMDPGNKEVFWVELGKEPGVFSSTIDDEQFDHKHKRESSPSSTIVESGLHSPEDIALDTIGRNLYITDAGIPAIIACSIKHNHCKIIYDRYLHKPRAIIVNPSTGWLTYTDWGDRPGLYLLTMDGRKREVLVDTDVVWPNGLAADYGNDQLYWADARLSKIECIDLVTRKRREVIREAAGNPFSLSIFEQRIYWSDWSGNVIKTCNKVTGLDTKNITHAENIYGIHIYHPSVHKSPAEYDNPCWSKRCSHLCLIGPTSTNFTERKSGAIGGYCACPQSMALGVHDMSTCFERHLSFLLINVNNYIAQIFPERIGMHVVEKILSSRHHTISDVASDWLHFRIFFFDSARSSIHVVDLSEKIPKISLFLKVGSSITGLLYDPWTDNLYWLNPEKGTISTSPTSGHFEVVLRKNLNKTTSMALDKKNRYFYVGFRGKIVRMDFSGLPKNDLILVDNEIETPIALQLDDLNQRLYWADSSLGTIESVGISVHHDDDRITHRKQLGGVIALAVYFDRLLWSVKSSNQLSMTRISDPLEERAVTIKLPLGTGDLRSETRRLLTINPLHEIVGNTCQIQGCSHGCTLDSAHNAICFCPPDLFLINRTTCRKYLPPPAPTVIIPPSSPSIPPSSPPSPPPTSPSSTTLKPTPSLKPSTTSVAPTAAPHEHVEVSSELISEAAELHNEDREGNSMIWLIVLLLLLSVTGLITLAGLILYKQGRLPKQVSQLTVSFIPQSDDKDGAMLLVDEET